MAENTSRGLFTLNGITGMLIATILLLSILAFLVMNAIAINASSIRVAAGMMIPIAPSYVPRAS